MFIAHFGARFSFKKTARPVSLGLLFLAVQFLDLSLANIFIIGSVNIIAWAGQAMWLFVMLGFWTDKNRTIKTAQ